jgi:hypothetical protein
MMAKTKDCYHEPFSSASWKSLPAAPHQAGVNDIQKVGTGE